ncbi:unnamed protein product [Paramecium primaurelia]|uniref:Transmembrane protein n=1 Tax=Paramecium primaurelia TaxID=5886 RepID=A0A8S1JQY0_PARPR|nr:unnamed protein product [Paramecium primaurelia]
MCLEFGIQKCNQIVKIEQQILDIDILDKLIRKFQEFCYKMTIYKSIIWIIGEKCFTYNWMIKKTKIANQIVVNIISNTNILIFILKIIIYMDIIEKLSLYNNILCNFQFEVKRKNFLRRRQQSYTKQQDYSNRINILYSVVITQKLRFVKYQQEYVKWSYKTYFISISIIIDLIYDCKCRGGQCNQKKFVMLKGKMNQKYGYFRPFSNIVQFQVEIRKQKYQLL